MNRYMYSVFQIMPHLSAGESVNFAVVAGNDQLGDWSLRRVQDMNRARRFCGVDAMTAATEFLGKVEERIDSVNDQDVLEWLGESAPPETPPMTEQFLSELSGWQRGVVRFSAPMPVIAESSEDALDLLVSDLLVEPVTRVFKRMTKKRLVADMKTAYRAAGVEESNLWQRPLLHVGKSEQFRFGADFVVATHHAVQVCNAWSFQISDLDEVRRSVQAWGWNMRELRDHGGVLSGSESGEAILEVPPAVELRVIIAPDTSTAGLRALEDATYVFEEVQAVVVPYAERNRVAEAAFRLVS
ncbi:hypothetical protein FHT44_003316 [Mycolicibacterium sp. BK634]|uniref:DUF3037 domain-containing protein n=1 Tax=Mycolicibacterium sp. BK634 TaxID=2587099 RepID=UPI00161966BB|nr:DUF3037 domain-containing protein [Mycolicibacterium sp. BK634]MBB3750821.1 hypothetical protein [Mycolicibacterium sp. BK634]